jgi:hypothetical protein
MSCQLDDAMALAIAAGFEPASSAPEVTVAYTTGLLAFLQTTAYKLLTGEQTGRYRRSTTELPEQYSAPSGNRTHDHRLKRRSNRFLHHRSKPSTNNALKPTPGNTRNESGHGTFTFAVPWTSKPSLRPRQIPQEPRGLRPRPAK